MNKRIDNLIRDLGSKDYNKRQAAADALRNMGPAAYDRIRDAAKNNPDPHVRDQASKILDQYRRQISSKMAGELRKMNEKDWDDLIRFTPPNWFPGEFGGVAAAGR
jgi:hypothetical protein